MRELLRITSSFCHPLSGSINRNAVRAFAANTAIKEALADLANPPVDETFPDREQFDKPTDDWTQEDQEAMDADRYAFDDYEYDEYICGLHQEAEDAYYAALEAEEIERSKLSDDLWLDHEASGATPQ